MIIGIDQGGALRWDEPSEGWLRTCSSPPPLLSRAAAMASQFTLQQQCASPTQLRTCGVRSMWVPHAAR